MSKVLAYTFSEATSTVRDYSENDYDGTGTGLSFVNSDFNTNTGKDCVFNAGSDQIDLGTMDELDGSSSMTIGLRLKINSTTGNSQIIYQNGQISATYDYTTNDITVNLTVASGTATITYGLSVGTWYDLGISYAANTLIFSIDGTTVATDATKSGAIANGSGNFYIGYNPDTGDGSTYMNLNEFLILDVAATADQVTALLDSPCGILSTSNSDAFESGDIIATDIDSTIKYAIVSWYDSGNGNLRIYPMTSGITSGSIFRRVGHLWDTTRQWALKIDDTPQICFFDGQSKTTEVFTDAKKVWCATKEGVLKPSVTKTANYTATGADSRIYVDSSGGAFTITLEASPTTNKEIEIIDSTGNCASFNVTVAGNGNNIVGSANYVMATDYEGLRLIFNGSNWNLN